MRTFDLLTPADAFARFNAALHDAWSGATPLQVELVPTSDARDRILARDVASPSDVPEFRRSTVDGYAVRAADTPGRLRVRGEVRMGELSDARVGPGEALVVSTGGHVPEGADAVLMVEHARAADAVAEVLTDQTLRTGDNLIGRGEDLRAGDPAVRAGMRLREAEIGGLLSLGITRVPVFARPRVAFISSGDELVPPEEQPGPGQVRQINSAMLASVARRNGGAPIVYDTLPDRLEAFERAAARAMREADVVVFVAATSMGERDFVPEVVAGLGRPGVLAHGIAFRPGKPTLFAVCDGIPVLGLPGNPISALVTAQLFLAPTLWRMQGALAPPRPAVVRAALAADFRSPRNLEHWFPVALSDPSADRPELCTATPIASKSNLIFSLSRAGGLACAPIGVDRLPAGSVIDVTLLG